MDQTLVKSFLISVGLHAILAVPSGAVVSPLRVDVIRGPSGIDLEWSPQDDVGVDLAPREEGKGAEGALTRWEMTSIRNPAPRYPWIARLQGWEGRVLLRAVVDPSGHPLSLLVVSSSGHPELDLSALNALSQWQFLPARRDGQAVASEVEIPFLFELQQKE